MKKAQHPSGIEPTTSLLRGMRSNMIVAQWLTGQILDQETVGPAKFQLFYLENFPYKLTG